MLLAQNFRCDFSAAASFAPPAPTSPKAHTLARGWCACGHGASQRLHCIRKVRVVSQLVVDEAKVHANASVNTVKLLPEFLSEALGSTSIHVLTRVMCHMRSPDASLLPCTLQRASAHAVTKLPLLPLHAKARATPSLTLQALLSSVAVACLLVKELSQQLMVVLLPLPLPRLASMQLRAVQWLLLSLLQLTSATSRRRLTMPMMRSSSADIWLASTRSLARPWQKLRRRSRRSGDDLNSELGGSATVTQHGALVRSSWTWLYTLHAPLRMPPCPGSLLLH